MKALIRLVFAVAVAFLLAACLFGLRSACDPANLRILIQEDRRGEQLQQSLRAEYHFFESKERIVREVIAQRCSLREALAQWEKLDCEWLQEVERELPNNIIKISETHRFARLDADYYYRRITEQVAEFLRDRSEEAALVLGRLEKEYQQIRASRQTFSSTPPE